MKYFVLRCSEDGNVSLTTLSKAELESSLANPDDGGMDASEAVIPHGAIYDFASGECPLVIIRGEAIMPKAAAKVTKWEI